jgi:hypothetical protein
MYLKVMISVSPQIVWTHRQTRLSSMGDCLVYSDSPLLADRCQSLQTALVRYQPKTYTISLATDMGDPGYESRERANDIKPPTATAQPYAKVLSILERPPLSNSARK